MLSSASGIDKLHKIESSLCRLQDIWSSHSLDNEFGRIFIFFSLGKVIQRRWGKEPNGELKRETSKQALTSTRKPILLYQRENAVLISSNPTFSTATV